MERHGANIGRRLRTMILAAVIAAGCLMHVCVYADEPSWPSGPDISTPNAIVMEADTGTVLYEKNADEQRYPASITKIMTTMLALENCPLDEVVTFSADAVYKNEGNTSHIARDLGEEMTMEQCLYAVMLESANECAYAVAEHVGGGTCQNFVDMMNAKAEELGCTNTHFANPNGLPDESHVTSCRDMALIARAAIQNEEFRKITSTVRYTIPPTNKHDTETMLNNHHRMISKYKGAGYIYEYAIGGKTGYTVAAGSTLVTYAEKDGMLLICVVMNSDSTHYEDTIKLFDYCFSNYQICNISQSETRYENAADTTGSLLFADAEPYAKLDDTAKAILPAAANFADTETEISYDHVSDQVIGTLVYSYAGREIGRADVIRTGASGSTYEFGKKEKKDTSDLSAEPESDENDTKKDRDSEKSSALDRQSGSKTDLVQRFIDYVKNASPKERLFALGILAAILIVILVIILSIINSIRREIRRRRRRRERRYRTIPSSNRSRSSSNRSGSRGRSSSNRRRRRRRR